MTYFILFLAGIVAYIISTLAAGGGALIMVPLVGFYLSPAHVAPVVNLGNMIGRPTRLILFWKHIDWRIVKFYVPFAIAGAFVGGLLFVKLQAQWLQVLLGLFLISTVLQFRFGKKKSIFPMKAAYFMPLGFAVTFTSTLFGATGPIMNPFYLNMGLVKERMIATKTANSFLAGIAQLGSYAFLGALEGDMWFYGLAIGLGATLGNVIGKRQLKKVSNKRFRQYVIALMVLSGVLMVGKGLV